MSGSSKKNHAVILSEYNSNLVRAIAGLRKEKRELRKLNKKEVLIKTEAAPCNPSDIAFIRGGYNIRKNLTAVPGFEGAGVIVDTGRDVKHLLGKRVSSFTQADSDGTWAEYFISRSADCLILKDGLDFEQAAALSVNPFTAYGLMELAVKKNCKTIVQNAGGGQIAEFIRVLAKMNNIEVINIVRKEEQLNALKDSGSEHVINSSENDFSEKLTTISRQLKAGMAFDAAGGEQTGILLKAMDYQSDVVLYGGLAGTSLSGIDPFDIIFRDKKLSGFNLNEWKSAKSPEKFEIINNHLQDLIIEGRIRTKIQASFKLDNAVEALRTYIKSMSAGKILFKPSI